MRQQSQRVQSILNLTHGDTCNSPGVTIPDQVSVESCTNRSVNVNFNSINHTYLLRNGGVYRMPILSVTAACSAAEPPFDEKRALACVMRKPRKQRYVGLSKEEIIAMWNDSKTTAAKLGTEAHFEIECMLCGLPYRDIPEVDHALYCLEVVCAVLHINFAPSDICVFEVEGILTGMGDEIAGSPDLLLKLLPNKKLVIVDWKRSTAHLQNQARDFMSAPLQDSYYSKYHAQLNFYAFLLEEAGYEVAACFLCNVHPECEGARVVRVPLRPILARRIACALRRRITMLQADSSVPKCTLSGCAVKQTCMTTLGEIDVRVAKALGIHVEELGSTCESWERLISLPFTSCTQHDCCDSVETHYIADMAECIASVDAVLGT